jgi:putative hemolysin
MIDWSSLVFFILTILLMGFFAGIEMAFFSANRLTIEVRKKQGGRSGKILSDFIETPDHFLGTTLIGFNLFLVFFGLVLSKVMNHLIWERLHIDSGLVRIVSEITLATIIILIFAEFIPRAIFRARSNTLLSFFARLISIFHEMFYPIAEGLIEFGKWILKIIFNVRVNKNKEALKRSDLKNLFLQRINDEDKQESDNAWCRVKKL